MTVDLGKISSWLDELPGTMEKMNTAKQVTWLRHRSVGLCSAQSISANNTCQLVNALTSISSAMWWLARRSKACIISQVCMKAIEHGNILASCSRFRPALMHKL